jgi:hypothetical protein
VSPAVALFFIVVSLAAALGGLTLILRTVRNVPITHLNASARISPLRGLTFGLEMSTQQSPGGVASDVPDDRPWPASPLASASLEPRSTVTGPRPHRRKHRPRHRR